MKRIGIILARICFIGMVLTGCSSGPEAEYTMQFKLIDGSWTEPKTFTLPTDGSFRVGPVEPFSSLPEVRYVTDWQTWRVRVGAIDYKILSVKPTGGSI